MTTEVIDDLEARKQALIANEGHFQSVCSKLVDREVIHYASTLFWEISKVAGSLDDYETYLTLIQGEPEYEEAVTSYIEREADLTDLEKIADLFRCFNDVLESVGVPTGCGDVEEWLEAYPNKMNHIKTDILRRIDNASAYQVVAEEMSIDPEYSEIYEHWIVTDWLGQKLKQHGEVVDHYLGFTIWGRGTSGQAISMDYVIRKILKDLDATWWYWREPK